MGDWSGAAVPAEVAAALRAPADTHRRASPARSLPSASTAPARSLPSASTAPARSRPAASTAPARSHPAAWNGRSGSTGRTVYFCCSSDGIIEHYTTEPDPSAHLVCA
ncbi:nematocyst expressed protein 3-like [Narcine bancroftii]|uniref:nematocyst expressed protein 3-like n=1 Tax=Narcine bancroftii TaxID=1343680 RepID=UPI0038318C09